MAAKFTWNEAKRLSNLNKHGIDFDHCHLVFEEERSFACSSSRDGEQRWVIVGALKGRLVAVVYTMRGDTCRIISARAARKEERALWLRNASKPS